MLFVCLIPCQQWNHKRFNLSCGIMQMIPWKAAECRQVWRAGGQEGRVKPKVCPMWSWASPAASWTQTTRLSVPQKHRWPPTKWTHMVSEPQNYENCRQAVTQYNKHVGNIAMYILKSSLICIYQCVCWFGDVTRLKALLNLLKLKHFCFLFFSGHWGL